MNIYALAAKGHNTAQEAVIDLQYTKVQIPKYKGQDKSLPQYCPAVSLCLIARVTAFSDNSRLFVINSPQRNLHINYRDKNSNSLS